MTDDIRVWGRVAGELRILAHSSRERGRKDIAVLAERAEMAVMRLIDGLVIGSRGSGEGDKQ